jgi:hypothetical protein
MGKVRIDLYSLLLLYWYNPNPIHEHQLPPLPSSTLLALISILCKKKKLSTKNLHRRILISNINLITCFRPYMRLITFFLVSFLDFDCIRDWRIQLNCFLITRLYGGKKIKKKKKKKKKKKTFELHNFFFT